MVHDKTFVRGLQKGRSLTSTSKMIREYIECATNKTHSMSSNEYALSLLLSYHLFWSFLLSLSSLQIRFLFYFHHHLVYNFYLPPNQKYPILPMFFQKQTYCRLNFDDQNNKGNVQHEN